jgi:transposase
MNHLTRRGLEPCNAVASVFKPTTYGRLRDLVKTQLGVVQDLVRVKNRLHSVFRARGVQTAPLNQELFDPERRNECVKMIPHRSEWSARSLFKRLDALMAEKKDVDRALVAEAKRHASYSTLISFPSIDPIRAAQLMAVVVTPHRFRTKRQFWAYCGLAIRTEASGEYRLRDGHAERRRAPMTRGLRAGNAVLKNVFKGTAMHIVAMKTGELYADYEGLRAPTSRSSWRY